VDTCTSGAQTDLVHTVGQLLRSTVSHLICITRPAKLLLSHVSSRA